MKIVLRQDVPKLGEAGSVQEVAIGYARNFLIPRGMAIVATAGEQKVAAHNQAVKDRKIVKQEQLLQSLADRIDGQRLEFTARSGEQGRLYGSITAGDVAERLSAAVGEEIDRRRVVLEEPIRSIGDHAVTVHLVGRLRPQVRVIVQGEADEAPEEAAAADGDEPTDDAASGDAAAGLAVVAAQERETTPKASDEPTPGSAGHPEPGSGHDDGETETVEQGPEVPLVDGVPGAFGEVDRDGGPLTLTETEGQGVEVAEEMDAER